MFLRIFLAVGLLIFAILIVMGADPLNAATRSLVVFAGSVVIFYVSYSIIQVIGRTKSINKEATEQQEKK